MQPFKTIVIVGLGLMGGSLAARARKVFPRVKIIGITRSRAAWRWAKQKGWLDEGDGPKGDGSKGDKLYLSRLFKPGTFRTVPPGTVPFVFVILCTPVHTLKSLLKHLDRAAPPGTIVTDVGSVKGFLVRWAERHKWRNIQFVGAHPMAGSHEQGIRHARGDLFAGAVTFVTPGRSSRRGGIRTVIHFWKKISGRVVVVSPEKHDRLVAEMSHFPHLVAPLLVRQTSPAALRFGGSGFLDSTRLALASPELWQSIFRKNPKELLRVLARFEKSLRRAKRLLRKGDWAKLGRILSVARRRRRLLESGR